MSFRLFIYYCSLCGAGAALAGWFLGRLRHLDTLAEAGLKGLCLGMTVALALGLVDAVWNYSFRQVLQVAPRALVALVVGGIGGLLGGVASQLLLSWTQRAAFVVPGWVLTGLLIGGSLGLFDWLLGLVLGQDARGARRKIVHGLLGGTTGGLLGGVLFLLLQQAWRVVFRNKPFDELSSPPAIGFATLGACIGLMTGLAQVILKEAWVRVEAGFRKGRELILSKPVVTIGRAESCDIGLFGDATVERLHARILLQGQRYLLADAGAPGGTFLNGQPLAQPTPLQSGDLIGVGKCVLRFSERTKKAVPANA